MTRKPSRPILLAALASLVACGLTLAATSWARPAADSPLDLLAARAVPFPTDTVPTLGARVLEHVASRLELTDSQREEIRSLASDHGPEMIEALRRVKQRRVEFFQSIHEHPPYEPEIREASTELAKAQTDLALLRAALADDIHGVLTPAQQDELDEMKQNLRTLLEMGVDGLTDRLAARLSA